MGWRGRVPISFIISDSGCVEDIRVMESSGHEILDAQAVKTIKNCQPFPKPPMRAEVIIPIVFRIG
jgi:protein TonB